MEIAMTNIVGETYEGELILSSKMFWHLHMRLIDLIMVI